MVNKLLLPDVTLLAASSVDLDNTQLALQISSQNITFGAIKFLTSRVPPQKVANIEYVVIPPMNFLGYSRFMLLELHKHVDTPYCLVVQADGFVLNEKLWSQEFFEYDYVGAPWPEYVVVNGNWKLYLDKNRVGNGGFSLRSRKLLEATAHINFDTLDLPTKSEDIAICHFLYNEMRAQGIRFAPPELAARFSIESPRNLYGQNINSVFGFHGKVWRDILFRKTPI